MSFVFHLQFSFIFEHLLSSFFSVMSSNQPDNCSMSLANIWIWLYALCCLLYLGWKVILVKYDVWFWFLLQAVRVEHCERVHVITAARRVCIANCRECVFFLGVNQRPLIVGDNHKLQVSWSVLMLCSQSWQLVLCAYEFASYWNGL